MLFLDYFGQPWYILLLGALFAGPPTLQPATEKLSLDDLVAKHVESVGTAEDRAAAKSRVALGTVAFLERISGTVHLDGRAAMLSSGPMFKASFDFTNPQYKGEQFVFDGEKVQIAMIDQQSRSALGNFLVNETEIVHEGLFGGVLRTGWPLQDLKSSAGKWKFDGEKKIERRELYELTYLPKQRSSAGELLIHVYFEPTTYRHVMTVYRLEKTVDEGGEAQASIAGTQTTTVEERFDDFRPVDGLTLPFSWDIRLRVEPSSKAQEFEWKVSLASIAHNKL